MKWNIDVRFSKSITNKCFIMSVMVESKASHLKYACDHFHVLQIVIFVKLKEKGLL